MGFYFNQCLCTGCDTCIVACKDWHDIPAGPVSWRKVVVIEEGKFPTPFLAFLATACYHCAHPDCVAACPVGALIKREEDGIVIVGSEQCLGKERCGSCHDACPYGIPQFREGENNRMEMCNLCLDRLEEKKNPICVDACPMRALDAGPLKELEAKYGKEREATGFAYSSKTAPSVVFKPKRKEGSHTF